MVDFRYPKNWKEMSLDMRLMFGYQICMMGMMAGGDFLTVRNELTIAAAIGAFVALVSRYHRRKKHWRWPGVKPLDFLYAVGIMALFWFFLYSATPLFPPNNGRDVPWYLAGLGIGVFSLLQVLKVVYPREDEFVSHCAVIDQYGRELEPVQQASVVASYGPKWKVVAKVTYEIVFMFIWVCGVSSFYFFGTAFKNGSPQPTTTQTEQLEDHGKIVYATPAEKERVRALQVVTWVGIPVVLVGGVVLHFLLGVKLFPNTTTMPEYLSRGKNTPAPPTT